MDFTKFISLIDTSTLFFASAKSFEDVFEGSWTAEDLEVRKKEIKKLFEANKLIITEEQIDQVFQSLPSTVGINCWHENEHQSAAMWKLYLKTNEGIAIQTTYERFKNSFIDRSKLQFGRVRYIDFEKDKTMENIAETQLLANFGFKRKSFDHEKEIRAIYFEEFSLPEEMGKGLGPGKAIPVDLNVLIEKIYISPTADEWFFNLVVNSLKKYGYSFPCEKSNLYKGPLF